MSAARFFKPLIAFSLIMLPLLPLAPQAVADPPSNVTAQTTQNDRAYIYLGNVKVTGQRHIVAALQAIKVSLQMPYSSDPKLANVVVCRLADEAGSHVKQWLICGTNRVLGERRAALHLAMDVAVTAGSSTGTMICTASACYTRVFAALNETLSSQPGHYLHTLVNGAALHHLLEQIPYPDWYTRSATPPPESTHTPPASSAPVASTRR